jgi:hypothetical protein
MMNGEVWNAMKAFQGDKSLGVPFITKSKFAERQVEYWSEKELFLE